jgi:putative ABC transport system permease protein
MTRSNAQPGPVRFSPGLPLRYLLRNASRRKGRFLLGALGVFVGVALMTAIQVGLDSLSLAYIDFATITAGKADAYVFPREGSFSETRAFDYEEAAAKVRSVRGVAGVVPGIFAGAFVSVKETPGHEPSPADSENGAGTGFIAVVSSDLPAYERLDLGVLLVEEGIGGYTRGQEAVSPIETGTCLVSTAMAERFSVAPGDLIDVAGFRPPFGIGRMRKLKVLAVVEQRGMFPSQNLLGYCVVNLDEAGELAGHPGQANFLAVAFADRRDIYDARDIHASVLRARAVGEAIQETLGLDYTLQMPKSLVLDLRESVTSLLRGIFTLFGAVALAISAILIYSLLSISVEERVRENAILRTLGGKKRFVVALVVSEGLALCAVGSVGGVFAGIGLTWAATAVGTAFAHAEGFPLDIPLYVRTSSVAIALGAGLLVSVVSSILPARKSVRTSIIEALNAYRSLPSPWKVIRERGVNTRLVGAGFVITAFMGFFTLFIPRTLASGDPTLVAVVLGIVLITLLAGMVLLSLGAQPLLERGVNRILRPFLGRASSLAERNLRRYRRRNTATALIFSLSVALVLFVASMATIFFQQAILMARFLNGADLRVETRRPPRIDFDTELGKTEGVDRFARVYVGRMTRSQDTPDWKVRIYLSDMGGIRRTRVRPYGVGPELLDAMYRGDIRFHEGDETAFRGLAGDPGEEAPGPVILPRSIASRLSVGKGNLVKLRSRVGSHRAWRILRVAAVTDKMPGFPNFFSGAGRAWGSGILLSREAFLSIMGGRAASDPPAPGEGDASKEAGGERVTWRTVYLVKKKPEGGNVGKRLSDKFGWARFGTQIRDTEEMVDQATKLYYSTQILFTAILILSVTIALFGLLASMYTTVLERRREIVILKALGIRRGDLLRMFAGETTSLLLTSGTLGAVTGFVLAYLLVSQQTVISELPTPFTVPVIPVVGMILVSVAMGIFGAWLPTRSLLKKSPAEIIRES